MVATRPLAYELRPLSPPTDMRTAAVLTCAKCGAKQKLPIMAWGNNPEKIIKAFIRLGWSADQHLATACVCPKCVKERQIRAEEAAAKKESKPVAPVANVINPFAGVRITGPGQKQSISSIKDLTAEQKTALRLRLEKVFDDATGRYIVDGQNDHLISEEMGIPRAVVVDYRELVFGVLQEDPEISDLRSVLAELKSGLADIQSGINKAELRINEVAKKNGL